jgi:hypothetical protein
MINSASSAYLICTPIHTDTYICTLYSMYIPDAVYSLDTSTERVSLKICVWCLFPPFSCQPRPKVASRRLKTPRVTFQPHAHHQLIRGRLPARRHPGHSCEVIDLTASTSFPCEVNDSAASTSPSFSPYCASAWCQPAGASSPCCGTPLVQTSDPPHRKRIPHKSAPRMSPLRPPPKSAIVSVSQCSTEARTSLRPKVQAAPLAAGDSAVAAYAVTFCSLLVLLPGVCRALAARQVAKLPRLRRRSFPSFR